MKSGAARAWLCALLAVLVWIASVELDRPSRVLPASAPAGEFSAVRAGATLARLLGSERPHPLSSEQNALLRARILAEFAALGVSARTYQSFTCNTWRGFGFVPCAAVTNIVAQVLPGSGKAIAMMAHYDSVPAGPGASDDAAGVAAVLETARALRASQGPAAGARGSDASRAATHPVLAVLTDGEEAGLLGAHAFLENADLRARIGAVVNLEARGTSGASLLFQTSPGNARLIELYAAQVKAPATSSLYAEIYRFLPNDTDLTLFIRAGIPAFNFAFAGNERYYHSPLDRRANLSVASLQMQGDNLLGVVRGLERSPYAALVGANAIYLSVFDRLLLRLPDSWALPLTIVAFLALCVATAIARDPHPSRATRTSLSGALWVVPALLVGAVAAGYLLALLARLLSGMPDPSYAYPAAMRVALAAALWAVTLAVSRALGVRAAAAGAWLWLSGLAILVAALLPGFAPYFLFPTLLAALLLLVTARAPGGWSGPWGQLALLLASLAALIVWIELAASFEALLGLKPHELFSCAAILGLMTLLPLLAAQPMGALSARVSIGGAAALALAAGIIAGLLPAYTARSPERVDLIYYESPSGGRWIADSSWKSQRTEPIPAALITAGAFHRQTLDLPGLSFAEAYVAASAPARLPLPSANVPIWSVAAAGSRVRTVTLQLHGSADTDAMVLDIPRAAHLLSIDIGGEHLIVPPGWRGSTRLACDGRDCREETVSLRLAGNVQALPFVEERYGLPAFGAPLAAARPPTALPSQSGDEVMLANLVQLP